MINRSQCTCFVLEGTSGDTKQCGALKYKEWRDTSAARPAAKIITPKHKLCGNKQVIFGMRG